MEDKKKADFVRGMFSNCSFNNSVVAGIVESGSEVFYNKTADSPKRDDDETKAQKQGKDAILEYVGRLKPVVKEQYLDHYDQIWEGILEINQVKAVIYNKGKQQDTTFNRNLLAKIIHQVSWWLYESSANTVIMAEYLEPGKGIDHPVRQKLGESPNKDLKKALEQFVSTIK